MKKLSIGYFDSIHECSIYSWSRSRKHSNFAFLERKTFDIPSNRITVNNSLKGEAVYLGLLTELWFEFGQSKELKKEIELRKDLMEVSLEYLLNNDRSLLNDIKLIQSELKKLLDESSKQVDYDFDEEISKASKHLGREINQKKTSVFEYYASTR
jgi:hypothetical protein